MPQRFLRPQITNSERWNATSFPAQSLYIRILTLVDDYGRYDGRVSVIWGHCFSVWNELKPDCAITPQETAGLCQELVDKNLAEFYESDGKRVIQLTQWTERARGASKWPDKPKGVPAESCGMLRNPASLAISPSHRHEPSPASKEPAESCARAEDEKAEAGIIAEGAIEIPDEKTAIELAGMRAIPADFAKLCFGDWMDNNGCNSKNIPKPWQSYVSTRWRYEQEEWRSGKHRGKQSLQVSKVGPKQSEVIAYAKEKGDTYGTYAVSWFSYWNDPKRGWKKNGVTIDWKNEFQNSYASHRQKEAA